MRERLRGSAFYIWLRGGADPQLKWTPLPQLSMNPLLPALCVPLPRLSMSPLPLTLYEPLPLAPCELPLPGSLCACADVRMLEIASTMCVVTWDLGFEELTVMYPSLSVHRD